MSSFSPSNCTEFYCPLRDSCFTAGQAACERPSVSGIPVVAENPVLTAPELGLDPTEEERLAQASGGYSDTETAGDFS